MSDPKTKRDYSKFFTPAPIADRMAQLLNPQDGNVILDPSAGKGALGAAIKRVNAKAWVFSIEINPEHEHDLRQVSDVTVIKDFLQITDNPKFSACIANPPFGNGIDLKAHVDHMRKLVKKGGRIVVLLPEDFMIEGVDNPVYIPIKNWSKNSDGTTTKIKIAAFEN